MNWIAPSDKDNTNAALEKRLWDAADQFRAKLELPSTSGRGAGDEGAQYTGDPARELSIHGVEKTDGTERLCRLNLAVHGLEGDIKHGGNINNSYDDPHDATGHLTFHLAA